LSDALQERTDAGLPFWILGGHAHEHADAPHWLGLLRVRRRH
jgi:hypothetical protein